MWNYYALSFSKISGLKPRKQEINTASSQWEIRGRLKRVTKKNIISIESKEIEEGKDKIEMSFKYEINNKEPSMDPWGTPEVTIRLEETEPQLLHIESDMLDSF